MNGLSKREKRIARSAFSDGQNHGHLQRLYQWHKTEEAIPILMKLYSRCAKAAMREEKGK